MFKLIVFDLDKTLADLGKGIAHATPQNFAVLKNRAQELRYARESRHIIFAALCGKRD